jgi:ERCC4-type nuclease
MLGKRKFTDSEMKTLLKSMTVIIDTRENVNQHITNYLTKAKVPFKKQKLDAGDYSIFLPANQELNIPVDIYYTDEIAFERKNSLEEISSNFTTGRQQFESELLRNKCEFFTLLIEGGSYDKILNEDYKTQYDKKSFLATLASFKMRYKIHIEFISKEEVAGHMCRQFYYFLREKLKEGAMPYETTTLPLPHLSESE